MNRLPPHNLEAEQCVLGSMMLEQSALLKGLEALRPTDFYRIAHQICFGALTALCERNEPCDLITLQEELKSEGKLEEVGSTEYLMALVDSVPTAANLEHYANIVKEKSLCRRLISAGTSIIASAYDEDEPAKPKIERATQLLMELEPCNSGWRSLKDVYAELLHKLGQVDTGEAPPKLPIGIGSIDRLLNGGLAPTDMLVVGADTSEGKSVLLTQFLVSAAIRGEPACCFTCEMSSERYLRRMIMQRARMQRHAFERPVDWEPISRAGGEVTNWDIHIQDYAPTLVELELTVKSWIQGIRLLNPAMSERGLVVVDYAGLITRNGNPADENVEMARIISRLKQLANRWHLKLVTASQVRKEPATARSKGKSDWPDNPFDMVFPKLADLMGSGAIVRDPDWVLILCNPKEKPLNTDGRRVAGLHVAKARDGEVGRKIALWFTPKHVRFDEWDMHEAPAPVERNIPEYDW